MKNLSFTLALLLFSLSGSGYNSIDSIVPTMKIEGVLIAPFIDSLKNEILSDTILFNSGDLRHFNYLSTNSKPYSSLYNINFKCEYVLDIINSSLVLEFVNEFFNSNNIKSIELIDPVRSDALFYEYGKFGTIIIFMKKKVKVNYKVACVKKLYKKSLSTNFDQNPFGQGRMFY